MKKFILISFFNILLSTYDSFRNECGPYLGLEDEIMMRKNMIVLRYLFRSNKKMLFCRRRKIFIKKNNLCFN